MGSEAKVRKGTYRTESDKAKAPMSPIILCDMLMCVSVELRRKASARLTMKVSSSP